MSTRRLVNILAGRRNKPGVHRCTFGDIFGDKGVVAEWTIDKGTSYWADVRIVRCPTCGQPWQASGEDNYAVRLAEEEVHYLLDDPPSSWTPLGPRLTR